MINIENENNFIYGLKIGINLFLGQGYSILAMNSQKQKLPTSRELAKNIANQFSLSDMQSLELEQLCAIVEASHKKELRKFLSERLTVDSYDPRYEILGRMNIKSVFTTAIDDLINKIFSDSETRYLNDANRLGLAFQDQMAVDYIALNGSILNNEMPIKFGASGFVSSFATDPDKWHLLNSKLQSSPTLFVGYSINDVQILQSINPNSIKSQGSKDCWILIEPDDGSGSRPLEQICRALGFQIIVSTIPELLDYLNDVSSVTMLFHQEKLQSNSILAKMFPHDTIPDIRSVPLRPVMEFYLGFPPQWSDIYLGNIHRTVYFNRARDSINAHKHTIIIGTPGCGKTTLLMQLAVADFLGFEKLIVNLLTVEKAHLIVKALGSRSALIFIDNFSDSLDGLLFLSHFSNIILVCAERDYNFGIVSHLISRDQFRIIDVTELPQSDIQSCLQPILNNIKLSKYKQPKVSSGLQPSLFEIIETNIEKPTLKKRFASVLQQLGKEDPHLQDLLVMISYVYAARVPVSMDMLLAYMRDVTTDYSEIYKMRDDLGNLISEYWDREFADDQDYFVPRSVMVGEAVLSEVDRDVLKRMLIKFHNNISPYRIPRFDVFRRHAFDASIMEKAFSNVDEGKIFYEELYNRDQSPYLLQHAAMYLSRKGRHAEAFEMIDKALTVSGGKIWSIRNSHAIILFKANIEHYSKPNARNTLRDSMQILTECYQWDKRRPFHAVTFSDQAIQYWQAYKDNDAVIYLKTAKKWLEEESKLSPWNRGVRRLLGEILKILESLQEQ